MSKKAKKKEKAADPPAVIVPPAPAPACQLCGRGADAMAHQEGMRGHRYRPIPVSEEEIAALAREEEEREPTDYHDADPPESPPMSEYTQAVVGTVWEEVVPPKPAREVVDTVSIPREAYEQLVAAAGGAPAPKPNMYVVYRSSPNPGYIGSWEAPDFSLRRMAETASGPGVYEIRGMLGSEIVETTYAEIYLDGKVERRE